MSVTDNNFSSKPKQIAQASIQVLTKVFGSLNEVSLIVISDIKLAINIAENFKTCGLKNYNIFDESLERFLTKRGNSSFSSDNLANLLKDYDMIMIGDNSQSKLIESHTVKKILKKRKHKPIFFVDCGIPGNISMNIGKINNCFLFDLNDLEQLYSSWFQNIRTYEDTSKSLYDFELKSLMDSFFKKLDLNLEQKMVFEKRVNILLKSNEKEIKVILKNFLKTF